MFVYPSNFSATPTTFYLYKMCFWTFPNRGMVHPSFCRCTQFCSMQRGMKRRGKWSAKTPKIHASLHESEWSCYELSWNCSCVGCRNKVTNLFERKSAWKEPGQPGKTICPSQAIPCCEVVELRRAVVDVVLVLHDVIPGARAGTEGRNPRFGRRHERASPRSSTVCRAWSIV